MKYLLDTHALIWALLDPTKLTTKVRSIIADSKNQVCVSVVSFWEIALKTSIGKFSLKNVNVKLLPKYAEQMGLTIVDLQAQEAISLTDLPIKNNHKDPFDRMIICQSIVYKMALISKDSMFEQYKENGLLLLW
ncbi:twitching motility protein PilT [Bacteroidia bacterium]|nr:twitching motility protein PilT [Bacteroidia bacterium]